MAGAFNVITRYHCYYTNDFGYDYPAFSREDAEGDWVSYDDVEPIQARLAECEQSLETERLRLAACGTAALGYFKDCAPEYRSASLNDVLALRARLAECERACDKCMKDSADAIKFVAGANKVVNDTLRAQLTETQRLLEVQLAVGDKLEAEVKRLKESELQAYKASAIHSRKAKKAEAELAALREACQKAIREMHPFDGDAEELGGQMVEVVKMLRDALGR